jgi:hypothetical protein
MEARNSRRHEHSLLLFLLINFFRYKMLFKLFFHKTVHFESRHGYKKGTSILIRYYNFLSIVPIVSFPRNSRLNLNSSDKHALNVGTLEICLFNTSHTTFAHYFIMPLVQKRIFHHGNVAYDNVFAHLRFWANCLNYRIYFL